MNTVIPMAGRGSRFTEAGYTTPKPFLPLDGEPMIARVVQNVGQGTVYLMARPEHAEAAAQYGTVIPVPTVTDGAARTVLLAKDAINTDTQLLLANSDQLVDLDIRDFVRYGERRGVDGLIMTFPATDPKWSYAQVNNGLVTRVAEKQLISKHATAGIYWFRTGRSFVTAAEQMIAKDIRTNGEFYVCPAFNELIATGKRVEIYPIHKHQMIGLGTPHDYEAYLRSQA